MDPGAGVIPVPAPTAGALDVHSEPAGERALGDRALGDRALGDRAGPIGVVVPGGADCGLGPLRGRLLAGLAAALDPRRYPLLLAGVADPARQVSQQRRWWQTGRIAGSVLIDLYDTPLDLAELHSEGVPVVVLGPPRPGAGCLSVWPDEAAAVDNTVRYLAALGHRRIARVPSAPGLRHTAARGASLSALIGELGLEEIPGAPADPLHEQTGRPTRTLLSVPRRPTAILYDSDVAAAAGLAVAAEMGLTVPRDLSVLSWNDSPLCRLTHPPLTAMSDDLTTTATRAARLLLHHLGPDPAPPAPPPPTLTLRASSALLRHRPLA
ncbi:substrate-binding domain-containing protein [Streptomyces sp. CA-111067]|uniref:substrate-binding domain-containing protein n=1 Tax=Streptomyces sp. CA-111067 TaxID=3240046 RepID=UPI003D9753CF